ncbi:hypothetical protein BCR33DRAFT_773036 [Rhizoclosmatium globosum]|uniref:Uncharacterized protein n=1 Tax=Rhizoclosmatium globosum TaxID=329046 RepID=A0A1Y2AZI8_9FUNG|nr:hypothetical protein BCR33DRAFT_773036 [Rhizoclosmatium globosum]|eukprot:ORY27988.1 hypothetical protein BCR33DRAFT_773036 [Rhizoclosmatium globosum]
MLQAQMMSGRNNSISEPPHLQDDDIESLLDEFDQLEQELLRDVRERRSARAHAVNLNQNLAPVPMARQRSTPFQYATSHVLEALNEEEKYQYQQPTGMKYLSRSASVTGHGHNIPGRHYQQYRNKSFQTTNMYAIDQYYVEQQRLFMRGQQDVSPATSRCTSPSTSHSEQYSISSPSPDLLDPYSDARRWSPPQNMYSQSRPVQKVSSPQLSVISTSSTLLNQSDARPKSPIHYPSLTAPFAVLLTSNQVLHGSLYRTNPTPPGTLPYQLLHPSKKKKGFSLSSLFKKVKQRQARPSIPRIHGRKSSNICLRKPREAVMHLFGNHSSLHCRAIQSGWGVKFAPFLGLLIYLTVLPQFHSLISMFGLDSWIQGIDHSS